VPVAASIDGILVEGFIDLLIDGPEGLEVVDYKTDQIDGAERQAALVDRYEIQAGAYALALATVLEQPIARVTLVFARRGTAVEHCVTDVRRVAEAARALLDIPH